MENLEESLNEAAIFNVSINETATEIETITCNEVSSQQKFSKLLINQEKSTHTTWNIIIKILCPVVFLASTYFQLPLELLGPRLL